MESSKAINNVRKINEIISNEVEVEVEIEGGSAPLKSNLKKSASMVEMSPGGMMIRKVSWSDAHGKAIAHVQEFEPRWCIAWNRIC
ncbi:hypothetical protein C2S53_010232 [Perilla frutescens var. hirtella]|uniref:Uncharacterized protein n=1 Tax=Perilla frutescens var. hirtella TaxID=608512 RepID=A0AAD4ITE9_PERFH|nr:hypothetical protein C2S53_010232 [Perilla frutescens var. hirtella]